MTLSKKMHVNKSGTAPARRQEDRLERILIAGSGGQGIILLGKLLANVALKTIPHITFFPNYGAEVRGGSSNCQVILATREIASPVAIRFDALFIMDQPSADKYLVCLSRTGRAFINSSLCNVPPAPNRTLIPATTEAERLGDTRAANLILLGAYIAQCHTIPAAEAEEGIRHMLQGKDPALIALNLTAFQSGLHWPA
jgi:2-oxoglutarate ferredoxin oxidoreductase subunit gamma